jgi:hypothetical protein
MSAVAEIVESISRHVESLQHDVLRLSKKVSKASENPDDRYQQNVIDLVLNPVFRSWCRDAGLSIYERDVLAEGTIIGSLQREKILGAMKEAVKEAVVRMKEESTPGYWVDGGESDD